ncbi:hypothetical protein BGZ61DRAFT_591370 [Ilyonectria robusta]|uniref:uncharacterized protein n=1 Tax=Ilyonectria robusta TaxID=1079257 RepID=UPI001E8CD6F2|nr:uncharacterized protein BGZ61DRAFT_591370 [Ilyonectria robusta]KAH8675064.1 hypothetical protein BGZ61DRAFT_591370 [Ilyonectria robusta]
MKFSQIQLASLLVCGVIAQTETTTASSASSTDLPGLLSQVPNCILGCLPKVGEEIGCKSTDLECLCSDIGALVAHMATCVPGSGCGIKDVSDGTDLLLPVCDAMSSSPDSAAVESASSIITAAIGPATATTTSNPAAMMGVPSEGILAALLAALLV